VTTATSNNALAALARDLADRAPRGSIDRPAGLCAAVCLGSTRTAAAAREALGDIGPADVRTRAAQILAELVGGPPADLPSMDTGFRGSSSMETHRGAAP